MKRRSYLLALFAMILATGVVIFILASRTPAPVPGPSKAASVPDTGAVALPPPEPPPVPAPPVPGTTTADDKPAGSPIDAAKGRSRQPGEPLRIPAGQPIPDIFPFQKERDAIQGLASTYDAGSIPALAAFLDHADPMVRDEARLGLLQLSRPEAAPVLRAAAAKAKNAEERAALLEAADFLSPPDPG